MKLNRKQGFSIPIDDWIRNDNNCKSFFEHILLDSENLFLNRKKIEKLYKYHQGGLNLGEKLFGLVMLVLWQKIYLS